MPKPSHGPRRALESGRLHGRSSSLRRRRLGSQYGWRIPSRLSPPRGSPRAPPGRQLPQPRRRRQHWLWLRLPSWRRARQKTRMGTKGFRPGPGLAEQVMWGAGRWATSCSLPSSAASARELASSPCSRLNICAKEQSQVGCMTQKSPRWCLQEAGLPSVSCTRPRPRALSSARKALAEVNRKSRNPVS